MSVDRNAEGLERLRSNPPAHVLVASDLHLGRGWDPVTETCIATENFLADHAFAAWLEHYAPAAAETLLILNGDNFDVLRISDIPRTDEDFERWSRWLERLGEPRSPDELRDDLDKSERKYGLKTHDYKTVWKILLTVDGHPRVLEALAAWVSRGGRVLFITGNHDVELYWPLVRRAIRRELSDRGAEQAQVDDRVLFEQGHVVLDNLYVEHGHQYERLTKVEGDAELPHGPGEHPQINLPLGSFVNRYVINRVEALDPFIDNVKPVQDSLMRLARQRPLKILSTYLGAWKFLGRMIAKRGFRDTGTLAIAAALVLPPILVPVALVLLTPIRNSVLGFLPAGVGTAVTIVIGILLSGVFPYVAGVAGDVLKRLRGHRPPSDHQFDAARHVVDSELASCGRTRKYVCMGHSHVSAVRRIDTEGNHLYLNTGTWIALWPDDRPDLIGRTIYTYATFDSDGDGYVARALEWDEHADRPRPATILVPAAA
jgi:UDP-2,3-diacylglucosamine pyrophosphatase LpxH